MFSVVIPVYNGAKFIEDAIKCVFEQTCEDWELIIVNDGSKDETSEILKKYADNDNIKIIHQPNQGVSAARNNGVANAAGSHIAFLDADDVWHKNHLEVLSDMIEKYPSAGLFAPSMLTEFADGQKFVESDYFSNRENIVFLNNFFSEYNKNKSVKLFTASTTCVSAEAFAKAGGFPAGVKIGEDLELTLVIAAYYPVVLSKTVTATYKKANSVATKDISFDPEWHFFDAVDKLYKDPDIPCEKKDSLKQLMKWFTMRRCRHYIIDGKKSVAWQHFRTVGMSKKLAKDNLITFGLFLIPVCLVKKIFKIRWSGRS